VFTGKLPGIYGGLSLTAVVAVSHSDSFWFLNNLLQAANLTGFVITAMWGLAEASTGSETVQSRLTTIPLSCQLDIHGTELTDGAGIGRQWMLVMIRAIDCRIGKQQKPLIFTSHNAYQDPDTRVFGIAARVS